MLNTFSPGVPDLWATDWYLLSDCCCCSGTQLCLTVSSRMNCTNQASLSITISLSLLKLMSIESMMPSNHLLLFWPLLLLPSIFPSIKVFSNESALHIRWPKYSGYSFGMSPSSKHSGLISFRIDWFDLLAVQGTLKSSPAQFESINSLALSLHYGPTLTSVHDYWKNHSFGYTEFCRQIYVSAL